MSFAPGYFYLWSFLMGIIIFVVRFVCSCFYFAFCFFMGDGFSVSHFSFQGFLGRFSDSGGGLLHFGEIIEISGVLYAFLSLFFSLFLFTKSRFTFLCVFILVLESSDNIKYF